jgi:hypothetical protein
MKFTLNPKTHRKQVMGTFMSGGKQRSSWSPVNTAQGSTRRPCGMVLVEAMQRMSLRMHLHVLLGSSRASRMKQGYGVWRVQRA